jgi:solute:Na+ symporter, SSS family
MLLAPIALLSAISGPTIRSLDLVIVGLFLLGVLALGLVYAKRNDSTEEYFLGSRAFPGWAVGLSMVGTSISSVTFLALPAAAYVLDWRQLTPNLMLPVVVVFAVLFFIPIFRQGRSTSAFEYLEKRFGPTVRLYGSISFLILQTLRLATVLYLVSIPVAALTGFHILTVVAVAGVFIALYTVVGGIGAVIWTDVIQTVILAFGGLFAIGYMLYAIPGHFAEVLAVGAADNKFSLGPTHFTLSERTLWIMMLSGLLHFGTEYAGNQNVVQRYLASKSTREARKASVICVFASVPTWIAFFFLGTCLYAFYRHFPDPAVAAMKADEVLPYFLLTSIPVGLAGLIISGCIAAAMSSLDSSINAISTIATVDILKRYVKKQAPDAYYLKMAKCFALLAGALMIGGATALHFIPRESIADLLIIIGAFFGGSLLTLFLLGFFTTRVGHQAAVTAMLLGIVLNVYLVLNSLGYVPAGWRIGVHDYTVNLLVNAVALTVGYPLGLLLWRLGFDRQRNLSGLTVWTLVKPEPAATSLASESSAPAHAVR